MRKKVAIIGTNGLPPKYGGFETMTNYLTKFKNDEFHFFVFCGNTPKSQQLIEYNGAKLIYLPFNSNGFQSIIYDIVSIIISWFKYDALIILGTPGSIILIFLHLLVDSLGYEHSQKRKDHPKYFKLKDQLKELREDLFWS